MMLRLIDLGRFGHIMHIGHIMRTLRQHAAVFGFYLLLACVITWPVIIKLSAGFMGGSTSDAYEMARHIWWFKHAWQNSLDPFWQSNLGYPAGINGVSLYANSLQFFPAWLFAFVMPLASAYNLTILLTMALNGWSLWFLLRYLLRVAGRADVRPYNRASYLAALLAGVVFMAYPTFQGHLFDGHAGLMVMWPVPLYVYALLRLIAAKPGREALTWLALSVFLCWLSPSGHMLQAIYVLLPLVGLFWLAQVWRRDWRAAWRVFASGALGGVLLLLFLIPVLLDTFNSEAYTGTQGYVRYSADLLALASPSFMHPLFGNLTYTGRVLGVNLGEGSAYLGVVAAILCVLAVLKFRAARWWLLLAFVAWLLALGPLLKIFDQPLQLGIEDTQTYITLPFALLVDIPGFNLARTPGRFTFTLALAVAVMAGYGAAWLFTKFKRDIYRYGIFSALAVLILFEYQFFWPLPTQPADIPAAFYALRARDDLRAVFNLPHEHLLAAKDALFLQTAHEKPLIAGQVTRQTPVNPAKLDILQHTLDPALLRAAGADVVIFHQQRAREIGQYDTLRARSGGQLGEPFYSDGRYALYEVPRSDDDAQPVLIAEPASVNDAYSAAWYARAGWYDLQIAARADKRDVNLLLDDARWQRMTLDGAVNVQKSVWIAADGYHTLRLALDPPCPINFDATLQCRALQVNSIDARYTGAGQAANADFARGVTLQAYQVSRPADAQQMIVRSSWRFVQGSDAQTIRFVHVVDSAGELVAQVDEAIGAQAAGAIWSERDRFDLVGLPPDTYTVYVGWYTYPELVNLPIVDAGGVAVDNPEAGRLPIGTFAISE